MLSMAEERKKKPSKSSPEAGADKKAPKRSGLNVNFWLDETTAEILQAYLDETEPEPSLASTMRTAVREFLRKRGYPKPEGSA